jgi:hypothetical protein
VLLVQMTITLLTFVVASFYFLTGGGTAIAGYHVILAIGILPLILAAMVYFVPVLTRTGKTGPWIRFVPLTTLSGGFMVLMYFTFPQLAPSMHHFGAIISGGAVATLFIWAFRLRRKTIGTPHPCLDWYLAALACLFFGLCAILAGQWLSSQSNALRLLHLHLNIMGFIGITALGTLQVLMPTVTQKPDPDAANRMRRHLKWILASALLTALSAAWAPSFSWIGFVLLAIPLAGIINAWRRLYASQILALHSAAPSLAAALLGYIAIVLLGAANGHLPIEFNLIAGFIIAFLMPLVTGAISYLLPQWLRPGPQTEWHSKTRRHLGFGSGARALILLAAGILTSLGFEAGWAMALLTACAFIIQVLLMRLRIQA